MMKECIPYVLLLAALLACGGTEGPAEEPRAADTSPTEATAAPASDSALEQPVTLVPGIAIGPYRLGMDRAAIAAAGTLRPHPRFSAVTLPIDVTYTDGVASRLGVSVAVAGGVVVEGTLIPADATMESAAELLGDCGAAVPREGGTLQSCRDGAVISSIGSGAPDELWLHTGPANEGGER